MKQYNINEGYMPFMGYQTYYRIVGEPSDKPALLLLHGGPNEYQPLGSLKDFEYTDRLDQIKQPCLICSGTRDICTPVVAASLYENIPNSRWEVFKGARHTCFVEQTDKYCGLLEKWLEEFDQ